ncbi:hypothetical protein PCCS19_00890 [Paenibacillus sp. CCS19]|nr:hypothetical protein PCCS19_00890 [Paenibacillus cellulosilyticus]
MYHLGQIPNLHLLGEVIVKPHNRLNNSLHPRVRRTHFSDMNANRAEQDSYQNLIDRKRDKQFSFDGTGKIL